MSPHLKPLLPATRAQPVWTGCAAPTACPTRTSAWRGAGGRGSRAGESAPAREGKAGRSRPPGQEASEGQKKNQSR